MSILTVKEFVELISNTTGVPYGDEKQLLKLLNAHPEIETTRKKVPGAPGKPKLFISDTQLDKILPLVRTGRTSKRLLEPNGNDEGIIIAPLYENKSMFLRLNAIFDVDLILTFAHCHINPQMRKSVVYDRLRTYYTKEVSSVQARYQRKDVCLPALHAEDCLRMLFVIENQAIGSVAFNDYFVTPHPMRRLLQNGEYDSRLSMRCDGVIALRNAGNIKHSFYVYEDGEIQEHAWPTKPSGKDIYLTFVKSAQRDARLFDILRGCGSRQMHTIAFWLVRASLHFAEYRPYMDANFYPKDEVASNQTKALQTQVQERLKQAEIDSANTFGASGNMSLVSEFYKNRKG